MKESNNHKIWIIVVVVIIILLIILSFMNISNNNLPESHVMRTNYIAKMTDRWIECVTKLNDPFAVDKLFCDDGNLVGTVSTTIRTGKSILEYFKWFTSLPNIKVLNRKYSITSITPEVYLNNAWVTWMWDGLEKPLIARMSFIFRGDCIYSLNSSALPDRPDDLPNSFGQVPEEFY